MSALAMRPRRGARAAHRLGADLAGCATDSGAVGITAPGAAATDAFAALGSAKPLQLRWPAPANGLLPASASGEDVAAEEIIARDRGASYTGEGNGSVEDDRAFAGGRCAPGRPGKARLAELAEQVRRICRRGKVSLPPCPSGLAELDEVLGGGFARGAIHELIATCDGAAARTIALVTAVGAAGRHGSILFIDAGGDFYPPGAAQLGVPLERLVIVRPASRRDALWACEQALRCTALAAVITSLARSLDTQTSRRLQLAAEAGRSVGLLIYASGAQMGRGSRQTFAASRLSLEPLDTFFDNSSTSALAHRGNGSPHLGCGASRRGPARRLRVRILKLRDGQPGEPFQLELPDPVQISREVAESSATHAEEREHWPPAIAV